MIPKIPSEAELERMERQAAAAREREAAEQRRAAEEQQRKEEEERRLMAEEEVMRQAAEAETERERVRLEEERQAAEAAAREREAAEQKRAAEEQQRKEEEEGRLMAEEEAMRQAAEAETERERVRLEEERQAAEAAAREREAAEQRRAAEEQQRKEEEERRLMVMMRRAAEEQQRKEEEERKLMAEEEVMRQAAEAETERERVRLEEEHQAAEAAAREREAAEQRRAEEQQRKEEEEGRLMAEEEAMRQAAEAEMERERVRLEEEENKWVAEQRRREEDETAAKIVAGDAAADSVIAKLQSEDVDGARAARAVAAERWAAAGMEDEELVDKVNTLDRLIEDAIARQQRQFEEAAAAAGAAAAAEEERNAAIAARQVHCAAADRAMGQAKECLVDQDVHGAALARETAAREWELAGEDPELWLQALDREIHALADAMASCEPEPNACEAPVAPLVQALGHSSSSVQSGVPALPQWPSLSISEGGDSGVPICSDSDEDEDDEVGEAGPNVGESLLERSSMMPDAFASCQEYPPAFATDQFGAHAHAQPRAQTPHWLDGPMVGVHQLAGGGGLAPSNSAPTTQSSAGVDHDHDNDPLPPFCTGEAEVRVPQHQEHAEHKIAAMPDLHRVCKLGDIHAARLLLAERADPTVRDYQWYCALHHAAEQGHAQLVDLLVCDGLAETDSETRDGLTALHLAVRHGHYDTVTVFLRHMSPDALNHQDQEGRTALHYASDTDSKARVAEVLVNAGGDAQRQDFGGLTPLDMARQAGARAVLAVLERTQRHSRGLGVSAMGPCIPLSPLQVDVDQGLWPAGTRAQVAASPPLRSSAAGMAPLSPASPGMSAKLSSPLLGRASPCEAGVPSADGWGSKSFVEEDIVTGRGEVWVARPLEATSPAVGSEWGMRTVAMNPPSPAARAPPSAVTAGSADARYMERGQRAPPKSQRLQGGPADFSNWEEGSASVSSVAGRSAAGRGPGASVMDLTKSVTDDWIVVDSDDEHSEPYQRRAAGAAAGNTVGEGDVWQERVKQAKGAALQVKMGITSFFQSLAK